MTSQQVRRVRRLTNPHQRPFHGGASVRRPYVLVTAWAGVEVTFSFETSGV